MGIWQADLKDAYGEFQGATADQALNPMPNIVEQNIERQAVCKHVTSSKYSELYAIVWREEIDCRNVDAPVSASDIDDPEKMYDISFKRLMIAVCAYQASDEVNSFSSKLDIALKYDKEILGEDPPEFPLALLTAEENDGHDLFYQNCARFCHNSGSIGANFTDEGELYTSDLYFHLGIPANQEIPGYDPENPDMGLYEHTGDSDDRGKFKVPTMRNVDKRPGQGFIKAYGHNGWFKSLESIVHFYNTRDTKPVCESHITTEKDALINDCWPPPEVPEPRPTTAQGIGNMELSPTEEAAIVAYMKMLTDYYTPKPPKSYE